MKDHDIEQRVLDFQKGLGSKVISNNEFIYEFMLAYGIPKPTISRIKIGGNINLSNIPGQIILKNKLCFQSFDKNENLLSKIDELKLIVKHSPRFIILTDFEKLVATDTKTKENIDIKILEIAKYYDFFLPLANMEKIGDHEENTADRKAAEKMAKLYDKLSINNDFDTNKEKHELNVFLSRILFCFFAEDTEMFKKSIFTNFLTQHTSSDGSDLSDQLQKLFLHLNTRDEERSKNLPNWLTEFPYVNGGIFKNISFNIKFNEETRNIIIECALLNWKDINPDIFGSMIQAVVSGTKRGSLGMHYTSVPNIMKVINPLFLNELNEELKNNNFAIEDTQYNKTAKRNKLIKLLDRIAKIRIFDPACGSGNFLIISYKEMCRLEIRVLSEIDKFDTQDRFILASNSNSKITLNQFYGIEIDDFAHEIAILSLHLAKHQINMEFYEVFGHSNETLPLKDTGQIVCENALRLNWNDVCPRDKDIETYILGNPPYLGAKLQNKEQKEDIDIIVKHFRLQSKNIDYISGWFLKSKEYICGLNAKYAFVSTNSICQGEQVELIWPYIFESNLEIEFAYPSFKWSNNAKYNAGVTVVIIGIRNKSNKEKHLYYESIKKSVKNINAYLEDKNSQVVKKRNEPISQLPKISFGSMPRDGGYLILDKIEKELLLKESPWAEKYIKNYTGSEDFINFHERYCLWFKEDQYEKIIKSNIILIKLNNVTKFRNASKAESTKSYSNRPHLFVQRAHQDCDSIIIPRVSSERRKYIPIGFLKSNTVIADSAFAIYNPEKYIFGVISSRMHMSWVRAIGGKLETRLRYSSTLCYNTFPFPKIDENQKQKIELAVDQILKERNKRYELTMADLYDPNKMPEELKKAHEELDLIIDQCYRKQPFTNDNERLEYLFKMYEKMTGEK